MRTTQILVLVCAGQRPGQRVRECGPARCQHQIRRLLFNRRQDNLSVQCGVASNRLDLCQAIGLITCGQCV